MVPLHFAFPDGVFHYVCADCTALCCRGQGFAGSLGREMGRLLTLHPELGNAVVGRQGDVLQVATPTGRCHFLDGDDLCRIEKEHGRAAKPGVCMLFPFNSFSLIGRTVVVSPHFMCPLRVQSPARPGEVEGTHARLEPLVRESGLVSKAHVSMTMTAPRVHPSEGAQSVLTRERAFRDRCGASIGMGSFLACLRGAAADPARLDRNLARAASLLGLAAPPEPIERDGIDDILLAIAPTVRLSLLRLPADGILLALAVAERVVRRVSALSPAAPTPQGVFGIIGSLLPALHLLGCADVPVETSRRGRPKSPPSGTRPWCSQATACCAASRAPRASWTYWTRAWHACPRWRTGARSSSRWER
ncbi:MAG: YkgJ family cysteine cluster protein [Longimicrobiales bacterium]